MTSDPAEDETPQYNTSVVLLWSDAGDLLGVFATEALAQQAAVDGWYQGDTHTGTVEVAGAYDIILDDEIVASLANHEVD